MNHRKSLKRVLSAVAGVMTIAAIWQFYVFVTFKNSTGALELQGGTEHLWWAIVFGLGACAAGFLIFSIFLSYDKNAEMHITSPPSRTGLL